MSGKKLKQNSEVKKKKFPYHYMKWKMTQDEIFANVYKGCLFGMAESDISVPDHLKHHFGKLQPILKNTNIIRSYIGEFMRAFAEGHGILSTPRRTMVASYFGKKTILTTPLLHWYLKHGLVVSHVYKVVDYGPKPCFRGFGDYVSDARRQGDVDPDRATTATST